MDFTLSEEQEAVAQSADAIFSGLASTERVSAVEQTDDRLDQELWRALADANLLGLAVPGEYGGSGLGLSELCLVLEAQGRTIAPVPLWATAVLGALPISRFGTEEHRSRWLPGVVSGDVKLSAALTEVAACAASALESGGAVGVRASGGDGSWLLEGVARAVPQAHLARRVLVPATTEAGLAVFIVDPRADGVSLERVVTTDRQLHPHMHLHGCAVPEADLLAGPDDGSRLVAWTLERARTALCAISLGVCEAAVRQTAAFLNERRQFGRPLASFQGAKLKVADAYMDTEAIRVTMWQAAWRIDTGRDSAEAVACAKWWAADAGQRVVHATQHLHGGIGADVTYPIHRYFLWGKQIELMLGGPSSELARLGSLVAARFREATAAPAAGTGK